MRCLSTILLYVTIAFLLLWQLSWCYNFFVVKSEKTPFALYSFVTGDFAQMGQEEGKGSVRHGLADNIYSEAAFDSILPMPYLRQLISDERFPDIIKGVAVAPKMVQTENLSLRSVSSDINAPSIGLHPLMEPVPGCMDLKMPDDVFRITTKGIESIDVAPNSVREGKSLQFTEATTKKEFRFSVTGIVGNPMMKEEYDEGYLPLNADRRLSHLKQVKGCPYVRAITPPEGLTLEHLYLTEFRNKKTPAFMTDVNNAFYALQNRTHEIVKTGIPIFNPETDTLTIIGNMFDWTVRAITLISDNYYTLGANDYPLIKKPESKSNVHPMLGITLTSYTDEHVMPRLE